MPCFSFVSFVWFLRATLIGRHELNDPFVLICIYVSVASQFVILGFALDEATS